MKNDRESDGWLPSTSAVELFSVIVPTYNRAHTIVETLNSVKQQTYRPVELIIADDGSTDGTGDLVLQWIARNEEPDLTCQYFYHENSGVCAARNRALRASRGAYIQFLDSDDLLHMERLKILRQVFGDTGCDYIETGFEGFRADDDNYVEQHFGHEGQDQFGLLLRGRLWPNTLRPAFTRDLVSRIGPWNESMKAFEDYEYVIRALTLSPAPGVASVRRILARARRDGGERKSDVFLSHEGRGLRIHCEEILCRGVCDGREFHSGNVAQLASRLYGLALRSNASGWPDHARRCISLADSLDADLDALGRRRRGVARLGPLAGRFYGFLGRLKNR